MLWKRVRYAALAVLVGAISTGAADAQYRYPYSGDYYADHGYAGPGYGAPNMRGYGYVDPGDRYDQPDRPSMRQRAYNSDGGYAPERGQPRSLYVEPYDGGRDSGPNGRYDLGPNANRTTREEVSNSTNQPPGTIVIDTASRHLYYTEANGQALRYGIGVGRQGFAWKGVAKVERKAEWPQWVPPSDMLKRRPDLPNRMEGGIENPLGARALYLFQGNRDTLFRIHGTNEPDTIGTAVSSGCIRMMNADVIDLYKRVAVGTKVVVL